MIFISLFIHFNYDLRQKNEWLIHYSIKNYIFIYITLFFYYLTLNERFWNWTVKTNFERISKCFCLLVYLIVFFPLLYKSLVIINTKAVLLSAVIISECILLLQWIWKSLESLNFWISKTFCVEAIHSAPKISHLWLWSLTFSAYPETRRGKILKNKQNFR